MSLSLSTVNPIGEDGGAAVLSLLLPSSYRDGCGGEGGEVEGGTLETQHWKGKRKESLVKFWS